MDISTVIVRDRRVIARFDELPEEFRAALRAKIEVLTGELASHVAAEAPHLTGELSESIEMSVRERGQRITGTVYTALPQASALEFGMHKSVQVKGHAQTLTHIFGREIGAMEVFVDPYTRLADIEGKLFMRNALHGMESEIVNELREIVDEVAEAATHGD